MSAEWDKILLQKMKLICEGCYSGVKIYFQLTGGTVLLKSTPVTTLSKGKKWFNTSDWYKNVKETIKSKCKFTFLFPTVTACSHRETFQENIKMNYDVCICMFDVS